WRARGTASTRSSSQSRRPDDASDYRTRDPGRGLLLGNAAADAALARRRLDAGRLLGRRRQERHVPQPRLARGSDRYHVRSESDELPRPAGVLLPDPRPDDAQPAGKRPRYKLQVGDFLHERGTTPRRRRTHRRRGGLRAVARQGCDRALACWRFLGGQARAPGLPGTLPDGLPLPLRPSALEAAAEERPLTAIAVCAACGGRSLTACAP